MSRNFKIGTRVRVKESGEIGVIKGREMITNNENENVKVEYIVKLGEGISKWKSFARRELENVSDTINEQQRLYPQVITSQFTYNKRTIVMVGVIDKVKIDTYVKNKGYWIDEDGNDIYSPETEIFVKKPFKGKSLSIGWAILHPEDNFDVLIGEKIALRRAKEHPITKLYSSFNGEFNTDMVEEILRNKSEFIFENIEKFIEK